MITMGHLPGSGGVGPSVRRRGPVAGVLVRGTVFATEDAPRPHTWGDRSPCHGRGRRCPVAARERRPPAVPALASPIDVR